jgi:hypothetical protein
MAVLGAIGYLRTGYQLRGAVSPVPQGPHRIVLLGDVQDEGIDWKRVARTHLREGTSDFLTFGDIIIRSRGAHYGVVMASDPPPNTAVAAPLFLLSIKRPDIMAEYVSWYLNRPATRVILENMAQGTSLPTISIRDLAELDIPVPPIAVQQEISEIVRLVRQERDLSKRLIERRALLADTITDELSQGTRQKKLAAAELPTRIIEFD